MSQDSKSILELLRSHTELSGLYSNFLNLRKLLEKFFETQHKRSLPIGEMLSNRWDRAQALGFGAGTSIYDSVVVLGEVTVGKNTWIGPNCLLDGSGGLSIGNNCSISAGVQIYTHDSVQWAISGGSAKYEMAPTIIGSNCYIGPNTVVARGVTIGDGCIIGAQSLVLKNVPAGSKAWGTPVVIHGKTLDKNA